MTLVSSNGADPDVSRGDALTATQLTAGYGDVPVVHDIELRVGYGELVSLLGANGAGKTTLLSVLGGAGPARIFRGTVRQQGVAVSQALHVRARAGLGYMPESRALIRGLRVHENLRLGGGSVARALELFPELERLLDRPAGLLSGGEQQILSLARTLAREPSVILADEVSLGLAPQVTRRLLESLKDAARRGVAVLMVEQHTRKALSLADRAYVLQRGRIVLSGTATELLDRVDEVESAYLSAAFE